MKMNPEAPEAEVRDHLERRHACFGEEIPGLTHTFRQGRRFAQLVALAGRPLILLSLAD